MSSEAFNRWQCGKARYLRYLRIDQPRVLYFHQVDDPYSQLAVQKLEQLQNAYQIDFAPRLVGAPGDSFKGDAIKFDEWARKDAASIAEYFSCSAINPDARLDKASVLASNAELMESMKGATLAEFASKAVSVGQALWQRGPADGQSLRHGGGLSSLAISRVNRTLTKGNQLRRRLGHYLSGTFYFEGEWYWGLDRLHLLERRLKKEGYGRDISVCPLPLVDDFAFQSSPSNGSVEVDYYPSLRSPYTAIGHHRFLQMAERFDVKVNLKPVMPMMMRGVPAPFAKQRYIMTDAGREARFYGDKFGPFCDPLGEPIRQAFAAFHCADQQNLGMQFVTEYLAAAFAEGLDVTVDEGLSEVCKRAGFSFHDVDFDADWQSALKDNLAEMSGHALWGVPSFRVSGGSLRQPFACWGQDRVWRVAAEIQRLRIGSSDNKG